MERNGHKANSKYLWDMGASSSVPALVFYSPFLSPKPTPCLRQLLHLVQALGFCLWWDLLRSYQEGGLGIVWVFKTRVLEKEGFSETIS